jgi:hypothetical protein
MDQARPRVVLEPVSVTFRVIGDPNDESYINVSNVNARELLVALRGPGADAADLCGEIAASDLAHLCLRFINTSEPDPGLAPSEPLRDASMARYVECGRRPGYLHDVAGRLWRLAISAGMGGVVVWE